MDYSPIDWIKALGPIAGVGIAFIFIGLGLVTYQIQDYAPKPLTDEDRKVLGEIWSAFSRQAFDHLDWAEAKNLEDLRAMFSAFNQTRITVQENRAKLSNRVLKALLEQMDKDFRGVQMLSPWDPGEKSILPDRDRMKRDHDVAHVADWMNNNDDETIKNIIKRRPGDPYFALYFELKERQARILKTKDLIDFLVTKGLLGHVGGEMRT